AREIGTPSAPGRPSTRPIVRAPGRRPTTGRSPSRREPGPPRARWERSGIPPNDCVRATRTTLAGGTDSAAKRSGRARDIEADQFGVRLGIGRGEYIEGHRSWRGCYRQFILDIGVQLVLDIGLEGVRLSQGAAGRHRKLAVVPNLRDGEVAREVAG